MHLAVNASSVHPIHKAHEIESRVDSWTRKSICSKEAQSWSVLRMSEDCLFHIYKYGWPMFASIDEARHSALRCYVKYGVDFEDCG